METFSSLSSPASEWQLMPRRITEGILIIGQVQVKFNQFENIIASRQPKVRTKNRFLTLFQL